MATEFFLFTLLRAQLAASVAIMAVVLVRGVARRRIGPALGYRLWWAVPVAVATSLLPGFAECLNGGVIHLTASSSVQAQLARLSNLDAWRPHARLLIASWGAGGAGMSLLFTLGELRVRRSAALGLAGPAVIGVAAPRLVVPADFHARFNDGERRLIRLHERIHIEECHPMANFVVAALQVVSWFNPLIHVAAVLFRFDQELACDALALEERSKERKAYARALLKAHTFAPSRVGLSLASGWAPTAPHPLELRLKALNRRPLSLREHVRGVLAVALGGAMLAAIIWAVAPNPQTTSSGFFMQAGRPQDSSRAVPS